MSDKPKKEYRKRRLFPRTLQEVVRDATKPLMDQQGKLYGALLRDWAQIVGAERARITRPQRLQFAAKTAGGAVLHLDVSPAGAPELAYATTQMVEQCARYFGYRAIERIVLHPSYGTFDVPEHIPSAAQQPPMKNPLTQNVPPEMRGVLERMAAHMAKKQ